MPVRILLMGMMLFAVGCATTNENKNHRDPAAAKAELSPKEFRDLFEKGDVLHSELPPGVSDLLALAEDDLASNSSTKQCRAFFFDSNGKVGELAKHILRYLTTEWEYTIAHPDDPSPFFNDNIFDVISPKRCSQFKNFSPEQKILFWTYIMQNLAFKESSCNPNIKPNTNPNVPNGPAIGLFQLELRKSLRAWRGAECAVEPNAIKNPKENTSCALKILKSQLKKSSYQYGRYPKSDGTKSNTSYWHGFNYTNDVWQWIDKRTITMCKNIQTK